MTLFCAYYYGLTISTEKKKWTVTSQIKDGDNVEENGNWVELGRLICESYSTLIKVKRGKESFFFFSYGVCSCFYPTSTHEPTRDFSIRITKMKYYYYVDTEESMNVNSLYLAFMYSKGRKESE